MTPAGSSRSLPPGSTSGSTGLCDRGAGAVGSMQRQGGGREARAPRQRHPEPTASGAEMLGEGRGWHQEPRSVLCPRKSRSVAWAPVPVLGHRTATGQPYTSLAAFQSHTRPRATIQAPAGIYIFLFFPSCLQHCYSHFPDGILKTRHKKSPNSSKLLQTTKLQHGADRIRALHSFLLLREAVSKDLLERIC